MAAQGEREVMTPAEVARKLGVGLSKVGGWIHSGELVAVNVATSLKNRPRWVIQRDALEDFLRNRRAVPSAAPPTRKPRLIAGERKYF